MTMKKRDEKDYIPLFVTCLNANHCVTTNGDGDAKYNTYQEE
jgi:hypothetical protein